MRCTFYALFLLIGLLCPRFTSATHLVGGHLEMRAVGDQPGHFIVTVTNYFENNNRAAAVSNGAIGIYRKRDNVQMTQFIAYETGTVKRSPIVYANAFCASQRNLNFISATFVADLQLSPAQYNDSQGYYIAYQTRNRNGSVDNLVNPLNTGFTFYLEFPALSTTGKFGNNSSPSFAPVNGEYLCLNNPFTFPFGGTDPDGDELRYSMITPLNQRTNSNNGVSAGPYPSVSFGSGYSADNAIPGSPSLSVDRATGQLSVTPTKTGLFVFAVLVEEYRGGQKIGEVRRDFQFLVVDCPPTQTPTPTAQIKGLPVTATKTTLCPGESATLVVTNDPTWNYQWQRDGLNMPGATNSELTVNDQGVYTVQVSLKNTCTQAGGTQSLTINSMNTTPTLTAKGQLCATDGSVTMTVSTLPDMGYQWLVNGQVVPGAIADELLVSQPGTYQARLTHLTLGCSVLSEPRQLTRAPAVVATLLSASGFNRICPSGSLDLLADGGIQYKWTANGQLLAGETGSTHSTSAVGTFSLTATDANGCTGTSPPLTLSAVPPVAPALDVLPPMCGTVAAAQTLIGQPLSGTFAGPGVTGSQFNPAAAGVGQHTITYSLRPAPECVAVTTSQTAIVYPIPTIDLPEQMLTFRGNSFTLQPGLTGDPTQFLWSPADWLRDAQVANAQIDDIRQPIAYTLWVANAGSCTATATIEIDVVDRLYAPDAFTPNGDGDNDQWEIVNAAAFPDLDVTVFNRWGSAIFHGSGADQPRFDGRLDGVELPGGVYTYVIRYSPLFPPLRGKLMLLR
ncbi:hypothetical protein FAES_2056 [Fibrella aestuarina BUZ 2]|uniref:Ig-like domain-containing protein n=1 Tax=Fibrella aestuarina BUZ 2 TaxID=1166018 RepID=I0K7G2_9BACT|nr:T9SS C-terminal target domain-containing protein [Fibrella aestuarina]CCH00065.1 hypothetical protein FAES_2056 [Fibrella aestuarina BUZ 2]